MPKLQAFDKNENKKTKKMMIGIPMVLVMIAIVIIASSYAIFQKQEEGILIKATVGDFDKGDVKLAITLDGKETATFPSKGAYNVTISCDNATGKWDYEQWGVMVTNIKATKVVCNLNFATYNTPFSTYLINLSNTDANLVKETHEETTQTGTNALTDYRYIGANPNNYVCLEASRTCTDDQLYRIIGVIPVQTSVGGAFENRVKLVKSTFYGSSYYWSGAYKSNSNAWASSTFNTSTLNQTYWASISGYQKYIGKTVWYYGASNSTAASVLYKAERSGSSNSTQNIGLMYASDYMYATAGGTTANRQTCLSANGQYWDTTGSDCASQDWLKVVTTTTNEWTLSTKSSTEAYNINSGGNLGPTPVGDWGMTVRPAFHLKTAVVYNGGTGTKSNPYLVWVN